MHRLSGVLRSRSGASGADVTLVTSPTGSPDVRSIVALNLAVCAGAEGARVLLVISDSYQQNAIEAPSIAGVQISSIVSSRLRGAGSNSCAFLPLEVTTGRYSIVCATSSPTRPMSSI